MSKKKHTYEVVVYYKDYNGMDVSVMKTFKWRLRAKLYYKRYSLREDVIAKFLVDGVTKRMVIG
jgi:hypothetical protein